MAARGYAQVKTHPAHVALGGFRLLFEESTSIRSSPRPGRTAATAAATSEGRDGGENRHGTRFYTAASYASREGRCAPLAVDQTVRPGETDVNHSNRL